MQTILIFEGLDNTGKTTIAKALSPLLKIPYFKNPREKAIVESGDTEIETRHGVMLMDFLNLTGHSVIFDRNYPSEYAYGFGLRGKCNLEGLIEFDETYAAMGTLLIYCEKKNPPADDWLPQDKGPEVLKYYEEFLDSTKCETLRLDTTDENIFKQLKRIEAFLQGASHLDDARRLGSVLKWIGLGNTNNPEAS